MLSFSLVAAALSVAQPTSPPESRTDTESSGEESLDCSLGPVERRYDNVQWYVFGCVDGETIVFHSGPETPEDLQFYFIVYPEDGEYKVYGEGNGDRALTRPAYEAISAMSAQDYAALHAEAAAKGQ